MSFLVESHYIGAYWGPRAESAEQCGRRLAEQLASLGSLDPSLSQWYRTGRSRAAALGMPVEASQEQLASLLSVGVQRQDDPARTVMPELGYSLTVWNGQHDGVQVSVRCGATAAITGVASNSVVVQLPPGLGDAARLYERRVSLAMFRAVVVAWEPAWCTFTNHRLRRAQPSEPNGVVGGWATFVAAGRDPLSARLPRGVAGERLAGGLQLTVAGDPDQAPESLVTAMGRAANELRRDA